MTEQQFDEWTEEEAPQHPPFRMRSRGRLLIPDFAPPTMAELRWSAQQRRQRRAERAVRAPAIEQIPERLVEQPVEDIAPEAAYIEESVEEPIFHAPPVEAEPEPEPEPEAEVEALEPEPEPEAEPELAPRVLSETELFDQELDDFAGEDFAGGDVEDSEDSDAEEVVASFDGLPAVLDPDPREEDEPARFARLRSPRIRAARPDWLDRGPLIDDPYDVDVPDLEPSLDLDFHPAPIEPREHEAWAEVWAEAQRWVNEPEPEPEPEPVAITPWRPTPWLEEDDEVAARPRLEVPDALDWDDEPDLEVDQGEPDEPEEPPLVSHVLVVRDPVGEGPSRIAVLDEPALDPIVVPRQPDRRAAVDVVEPAIDEYFEPAPEVPKIWQGRPAPLYWRVLRLRHIRPNGWLRALFFEGSVALAVVLVLAEAASVWTIVVLPLVVAIIVKANDVLVGNLRRSFERSD